VRRNAVRRFADHDGQLYLVICAAIRMSDHDWIRGANQRARCLEKKAGPLNLGDLILMMNFGILARLVQMLPIVDRRRDDLPRIGYRTRQDDVTERDGRLVDGFLLNRIAQGFKVCDQRIVPGERITVTGQTLQNGTYVDNAILADEAEPAISKTAQTHFASPRIYRQHTDQQYTYILINSILTVKIPTHVANANRLRHVVQSFRRARAAMPTKDPQKGALPPMRLSDVYDAPGHLIRRSQQISVAIFFEEFDRYDVTPIQYAALIAIRDHPGIDQKTLADQVAIDRSTIGTVLRTLDERGLITRVAPKQNMRIKQVFISRAGDDLLQTTRKDIYRVQERILAPLSVKERKVFMELLSRLVRLNNKLSRAPLKLVAPD
jgi:DNA-binding MarR family transcriptional regulator